MKTKLKMKNPRLYIILTVVYILSLGLHEIKLPFVASHISNFAITGFMLCVSLGYDLHRGNVSKFSFYSALCFWAIINIVVEFFVALQTLELPGVDFTDFNTPDTIDAIFGLVAIALYAFVVIRFCTESSQS